VYVFFHNRTIGVFVRASVFANKGGKISNVHVEEDRLSIFQKQFLHHIEMKSDDLEEPSAQTLVFAKQTNSRKFSNFQTILNDGGIAPLKISKKPLSESIFISEYKVI
jgi:hypothetical protein